MIPESLRRSNLSLQLNMAHARGVELSWNQEIRRRRLNADARREARRLGRKSEALRVAMDVYRERAKGVRVGTY